MSTMGSFPNISTIDSDDPHELRQQLLVLKAKMNEYRNKAEQAAYEVERRHRSIIAQKFNPPRRRGRP